MLYLNTVVHLPACVYGWDMPLPLLFPHSSPGRVCGLFLLYLSLSDHILFAVGTSMRTLCGIRTCMLSVPSDLASFFIHPGSTGGFVKLKAANQ